MKQIYIQVFLLSSFFLISSCGNSSSSSSDASQASGGGSKKEGKTLNILCWEGYASHKFSDVFEAQTGIKVNITTFNSAEKLSERLTKTDKGTFDVVTVSSDMAQALVERDLVQPIDLKHITHYDSLSDILRAMQDVVKDGATYGVPFTWGPDYLVYDADVIKKEPTSWNELFNPEYKGKVSIWDDAYNISWVGILNGDARGNKGQIYNMNDQQMEAAKKKLTALKPSIYKYWTSPEELTNLMRSKKVVIAVGLQFLLAKLRKEGLNIKGVIPEEGATGWIDRLMIPKNTANKELAEKWIDYITKAENMAVVSQVTGYCVSNSNAARYLSPEQLEITQMNNAEKNFLKLNFWQYVRNRKKYVAVWEKVKNGAK
jgi:spermidine/putrescine-binding protein